MTIAARRRALCAALGLIASGLASAAWAQAQVTQQTLDRVDAFNATSVLEMAFNVAAEQRTSDFTNLGIAATKISACKLTASNGLYCLDGKIVRNWPDTRVPATSVSVLSCDDPALAFDPKRLCTGMTVDLSGAIWLAGKSKTGGTYSLVKVVEGNAAGTCPAGSGQPLLRASATATQYCAQAQYTGRPRLGDLEAIDGDVGAVFVPCAGCLPRSGILGLEERPEDHDDDDKGNAAVFFPFPVAGTTAAPITLADRKTLPTYGDELLQSVTLLQLPNGTATNSYVLATTSRGRILAKNPAITGSAQVFDIPAKRIVAATATATASSTSTTTGAGQCTAATQRQQYGIASSQKQQAVYVTDRNYCQVLALLPETAGTAVGFRLINKLDAGGNVTLLTTSSAGTFPPDGATLAPGVRVELKDCTGTYDSSGNPVGCALLSADDGHPIASLLGVQLADNSKSGLTLLQVKGIPDCRYKDKPNFPAALKTLCENTPGVVVDATGAAITASSTLPPAAQRLNVTPLLPREVTSLFARSGGLPPLLISAQYRAQQRRNYVFEAFFAVTEPGVQFKNTFIGEYDVPLLEGSVESLGCTPKLLPATTTSPAVPDRQQLLKWDVITKVSEKFVTVGNQYVDAIVNFDCRNPTKTSGDRMSLVPYDLEITPDTYGPTILSTSTPKLTAGNDAVFARLVQSLYSDLGEIVNLACPLYPASCPVTTTTTTTSTSSSTSTSTTSLLVKYKSVKSRLDKCVAAAFRSRRDALDDDHDDDDYCVQFTSQLAALRALVPDSVPADTANRAGELRARIDVINHVFVTRFLPSIPVNGFCREKTATTGCVYPWTYPVDGQ